MIFALTKEPEKYDEEYNGGRYGLWSSYGHDPYLFCLMSRMNSAFFMYEDGFEDFPVRLKISEFDSVLVNAYKDTLNVELTPGVTTREWLESTTPVEWFNLLLNVEDLSLLPLAKLFELSGHDPAESIKACAQVRALQYRKFFRGRVHENGKVVRVAFKSDLTAEEEEFLAMTKKKFKEAMLARMGESNEK